MAEVDQLRPWLGLDSFSESTRAFFHGRDEEVGELARRVQRKLLTVLFGQSGLGKTSILRAGIVPRLRGEGYCPVYVRIDYGPEAPLPAHQVRMAIESVARYDGEALPAGESLWALLHQRSGAFTGADGKPVMPLLIFDQFEEIFTLAQGDGGARSRAALFIDELACLVENRPPRALEERMDSDDALIERYDFAREDYRVLISLREDYLAHLESLKAAMPSITQNRMRLAPMTGLQALQAVRIPGGALVTEEVAEAIVRFVAGGAELGNAQIEPSLLSLICRELNDTRIAAGRSDITLDLLAGSHASILSDFYERAMAGHPPAVRGIVEDVLLTDSGYRENVAQERIEQLLSKAGAQQGALKDLVDRRLLRIEERLDLRRVELTHDVLCSVVRASRDLRQEREARLANDRRLEEQKERERVTRKSLVRTRQVAVGSAVLAAAAIIAFGFAWHASDQANSAERTAETTRKTAAIARTQAELLIGYLNDDFARQLAPLARQDVVESLNKRTVDYYASLPAIAAGSETERNYAISMVRYGVTLRFTGRLVESEKFLAQAVSVLSSRRAKGDASETTAIALARALLGERRLAYARRDIPLSLDKANAALDLLAPWALRSGATVAARQLYAEILDSKGTVERTHERLAAVKSFDQAIAIYQSLAQEDPGNIELAIALANAVAPSSSIRYLAGRPNVEALEDDSIKAMRAILATDASNLSARRALGFLLNGKGTFARDKLDLMSAIAYYEEAGSELRDLVKSDPVNQNLRLNLVAVADGVRGELHLRMGDTDKALQAWRQGIVDTDAMANDAVVLGLKANLQALIARERLAMNDKNALATLEEGRVLTDNYAKRNTSRMRQIVQVSCEFDVTESKMALDQGDHRRALRILEARRKVYVPDVARDGETCPDMVDEQMAEIEIAADRPAAAVSLLSRFSAPLEALPDASRTDTHRRRLLLLALAQVNSGEQVKANRLISPLLAEQRKLVALRGGDRMLEVQLAAMLLLQARSSAHDTGAHLAEAQVLLAALPARMQIMPTVRYWQSLVEQAVRMKGKA